MASGCVLVREGVRGRVFYAKYLDADRRQVKQRLGSEAEGWTERKAQRELGRLLGEVEKGMRKPKRRTFATLADEFDSVTLAARPRKRSTLVDYRATLRN